MGLCLSLAPEKSFTVYHKGERLVLTFAPDEHGPRLIVKGPRSFEVVRDDAKHKMIPPPVHRTRARGDTDSSA